VSVSRAVRLLVWPSLLMLASAGQAAHAQGTYEIEVYSTEIAPVKSLLLELHSNYTFRGRDVITTTGSHAPLIDDQWLAGPSDGVAAAANCSNGSRPFFQRTASPRANFQLHDLTGGACVSVLGSNSYATHETIEAVTGLNDWSEVGAYLFTSEQASPLARVMGGSVRYKLRAPGAWYWPVNLALSTELEYDDPRFSNDKWTWEVRPVIDRSLGRWYLSVNPTLERTLEGTGVPNGVEFSPSAKATFDFTDRVTGGVEYYGAYGKVGGFAPPASRLQQFFGAVDLHVSPLWEVNVGVGTGTTPATSHLMAKLILGRRFPWGG
jgi:hypothetical protein